MSKNNKEYSPGDKARQFTLGSIARVGACIYLAYIIVSLIKQAVNGETGMSLPIVIVITALMAVIGVFLMVITVKEVIRGVKNKEYSMHKYYAEELTEQGLKYNSKGELVPIDTPDDDEEEQSDNEAEDLEEDDEPEEELVKESDDE